MNVCFADTFFFLALLNPHEKAYHTRSVQRNRVDRRIITSSWVLLELSDHLCDVRNRHLSSQIRKAIADDRRFEVVQASQQLLDCANEMYDQRQDKDWSLTDCTSFVIMLERGITEALTADHHFEQSGFIAILK